MPYIFNLLLAQGSLITHIRVIMILQNNYFQLNLSTLNASNQNEIMHVKGSYIKDLFVEYYVQSMNEFDNVVTWVNDYNDAWTMWSTCDTNHWSGFGCGQGKTSRIGL